jgi:hypothetical protein
MILGSDKMAGTFRNDFDPLTCSPIGQWFEFELDFSRLDPYRAL